MPVRENTTRDRIRAYIEANGYRATQGRVGLEVFRAGEGRKARHELTIGAATACLYELIGSRRSLIRIWDLPT